MKLQEEGSAATSDLEKDPQAHFGMSADALNTKKGGEKRDFKEVEKLTERKTTP